MGRKPTAEPGTPDATSAELRERFGNGLRAARERLGMTQEALGMKVGLRGPHISRVESGRQNLTIETMSKIAAGVGATPQELLGLCSGKP